MRLLVQSRLMPKEQVEAFWASFAPDRRPKDAQGLAEQLIRAGKLTSYQAQAVLSGRVRGLVLGELVVVDRIGAGGMGEVLKAKHRTMERVVAVKVLSDRTMQSAEAVERFRREVKAVARLSHPNIVTAYDAGEQDGIHFLVMEYVEGRDLARVVAGQGPLPVHDAVDYAIQAARGLEYAHAQGVVHRDVKPGNLLLDNQGTVKILDMGLVRMGAEGDGGTRAEPENLTQSGQVMGTCDYMAPEQAKDSRTADHRADVYSLGCTLYRLLTDERPYAGDTPVNTLLAHLQEPVPRIRDVRPDVPEELDQVVRRMMAKHPDDRPQSMREVVDALEAAMLSHRPRTAGPAPPPPPPQTESSTERKLTAFFRTISRGAGTATCRAASAVEETQQLQQAVEAGTIVQDRAQLARKIPDAPRRKKRPVLVSLSAGIVGLAAAIGLLAFLAGSWNASSNRDRRDASAASHGRDALIDGASATPVLESYLVIEWPEQARDDAKLVIDGQTRELCGDATSDGDRAKVAVEAGSHTVWIARRGYEPFERRLMVVAGQTATVKPQWRVLDVATGRDASDDATAAEAQSDLSPQEPPVVEAMPACEPAEEPETVAEKEEIVTDEPPREVVEPESGEAGFVEALRAAEALVSAWDFSGALAELDTIEFDDEPSTARLAARRDDVKRLTELKARIIEKINAADPPLEKKDLRIRGTGGQVVEADAKGITAKLLTGKSESLAWDELGEASPEGLVRVVLDGDDGEDWLAAGLLALVCRNPNLAESHFKKAASLGKDVRSYRDPLAAARFAHAERRLSESAFHEAVALFEAIERDYGETAWLRRHRAAFEAAVEQAGRGAYETEAEEIYKQAVAFFQKERPFDVKPLVARLKSEYASSPVVTDANRDPSFAEMERAVADLGRFVAVRQDGKGDYVGIQAAIDAVPKNSLIEIRDNGIYNEKINIPPSKGRMLLRGAHGCWPVVTSVGLTRDFPVLIRVAAPRVALERIVAVHGAPGGQHITCLSQERATQLQVRCCVLYGSNGSVFSAANAQEQGDTAEIDGCVLIGKDYSSYSWSRLVVKDTIWIGTPSYIRGGFLLENVVLATSGFGSWSPGELRRCTIAEHVHLGGKGYSAIDCIMPSVESGTAGARIEYCNVHGSKPFADQAVPGEGCFRAPPQFMNRDAFDYRLSPMSPCRGKASDGGDVGAHYTPRMQEMWNLALELRARGLVKF